MKRAGPAPGARPEVMSLKGSLRGQRLELLWLAPPQFDASPQRQVDRYGRTPDLPERGRTRTRCLRVAQPFAAIMDSAPSCPTTHGYTTRHRSPVLQRSAQPDQSATWRTRTASRDITDSDPAFTSGEIVVCCFLRCMLMRVINAAINHERGNRAKRTPDQSPAVRE